MEMKLADNWRPLLIAMYAVGVTLILATVLEPALRIWPLRPGDVGWRFGAVGLAANTLAGVVFGLGWMLALALLLGHRKVLRALSVISLFVGLFSLAVLAFFALDYLQLRGNVRAELQGGFTTAAIQAVVLTVASGLTSLGLGVGGWKSLRHRSRSRVEVPVRGTQFHTQSYGGSKA